ncbi:MAG: glycosyltransferase family 4 protein [Planctomycetota bacterium]
MKIAYIVGSYPKPSEQFIAREIEILREMGAEIFVYPIDRAGGPACPFCVLADIIILAFRPRTWRAVARFPFGALATLSPKAWREFAGGVRIASADAADMRAKRIEHVHACFATKPAAVGMMAAAMLRLPFTISAHARDVFADGVALGHKVAAAERVALCNQAALDHLASKIPDRLHDRLALVRHGLDLSRYEFTPPGKSHSPARVLAAGRFIEKKGFRCLVEAMARLPDCACEIAGAGPLEEALREQIKERGLEDRVSLPGWLPHDQLRTKMRAADVLVAPYVVARDGDRDGVPNILIEAAALGLPIVACNSGGIGELVINGETGRLVPPNEPELIAGAIKSVLATPDTTREFASNARKKVANEYDVRENVRQLLAAIAGGEQGR